MSMICVPVRAKTMRELAGKVKTALKKADMVEVWMDSLPLNVSAEMVRELANKPVIAVCKGKREKGSWTRGEEKRMARLLECAAAGIDYVDVDLRTRGDLIARMAAQTGGRSCSSTTGGRSCSSTTGGRSCSSTTGGRSQKRTLLIVSYHDFKKTPSLKTLKNIYSRAVSAGADIVKISTVANAYRDNLRLLGLGAAVMNGGRRRPLIITSMGGKGRIGRIAAPLFGSIIVFAALDKQSLTAPGQLTVDEYKKIASVIDTD